MKATRRRDKLEIYADLLDALDCETHGNAEKTVLVRILARVNVSYNRLRKYVSELIELGMVQDATSLKITEKGQEYLEGYQKILNLRKLVGL